MVCRREYSKAYLKTPRGMSKKYSKFLIYRSSYPEKTNAREKLKAAVQKGEIKKPKICSHCGGSFSTRYMQAHHVDYSKPLEVIWLCGNCHKFKHGRIVDMSLIEPKVTN
jgi:ribosomal protein S27AE